MGIPKLMKDLLPYTERAILGKQLELEVAVSTSSVVIDGPSLVYDVYRRKMRSVSEVKIPLAYRDINEGVIDLLNEIRSHGVDIKRIYFDGALPVSKRETRLERLKQHTTQLTQFSKARMVKSTANDPSRQLAKGRILLQTLDSCPSHNLKALEPPFMVASAIECLRQSEYGSLISVIQDEAEAGCIMYACRQHEVAVLSNDSDLVAFPSASSERITLILLHTLELTELETGTSVLMADCLRPSEISRRMKLSSLHLLAFQRYLDSSASAAVIRKRARETPTIQTILLQSRGFMAEYSSNIVAEVEKYLPAHTSSMLDPRLSELRSQYRNSRHAIDNATLLKMYLPALFEDPTRESPWAHGADLRQLAYSLLNLSIPSKLRRTSLFEYQRRGHHVSGVELELLSKGDLLKVFDEDTNHLPNVHRGSSAAEVMISWQQIAIKVVNKQRMKDGRSTSLPAIHLSACVQAVLYSFRLLKQVADHLIVTAPTSHLVPQNMLDVLATMPGLAELMDATGDLHSAK